jgi:hypothetical protein
MWNVPLSIDAPRLTRYGVSTELWGGGGAHTLCPAPSSDDKIVLRHTCTIHNLRRFLRARETTASVPVQCQL